MDFKKSLFFILCLLAVFASCSPEPKQEEAKIVTTNISVPSLFEVEEGQELIIPLRGVTNIVATDKVLLRDVAENEFVCDITDLKDGSRLAFRLPEKIAGGYYKFYIKRGSINYYVAAFTLNVMKSLVVEPGEGVNIYGIVTCDGEGVKDVLVSDGEEIVKTDENGIYQLKSNKNWMYVFVIIPSGYEVPTQGVLPQLSATLTQAVDMPERRDFELIKYYTQMQYNLYRMPFDEQTRTFGPRELIYDASLRNRSVTLPRISPDGRWLMFTQGRFGIFHIWHNDADLYMMDLTKAVPEPEPAVSRVIQHSHTAAQQEQVSDDELANRADSIREAQGRQVPFPESIYPIAELNSPEVESWHCWSSNQCWVVFSSRRVDGNFTRPFIAHFDGKGHFSKPFELPQDDPQFHRQFLRSYNIPEFLSGPVTITPQEFARIVRQDAIPAKLRLE